MATAQPALPPRPPVAHGKSVAITAVEKGDETRLPVVKPAPQPERSCRNCKHMQAGTLRFSNGYHRELFDCTRGHWLVAISPVSIYGHGKRWKEKAEACADFEAS